RELEDVGNVVVVHLRHPGQRTGRRVDRELSREHAYHPELAGRKGIRGARDQEGDGERRRDEPVPHAGEFGRLPRAGQGWTLSSPSEATFPGHFPALESF